MFQRMLFILITLFWVTMNVLLWRSEYGDRSSLNSSVPPETVWRKILTAPDDSPLNIFSSGKRIGFCRLRTSVGEELSKMEEAPKQGVKAANHIRFDGTVALSQIHGRYRFESDLSLTDDRHWSTFNLSLLHRPIVAELHATAADQTVQVKATDGEGEFVHSFSFSELQNPMSIVDSLGGPLAAGMIGGLDAGALSPQLPATLPEVKWEAWHDTLTIGHEPVRIFRLETRVMDRYRIILFVSRAGEILKAELPNGIILLHDKLTSN
jgi:hypothetical protein